MWVQKRGGGETDRVCAHVHARATLGSHARDGLAADRLSSFAATDAALLPPNALDELSGPVPGDPCTRDPFSSSTTRRLPSRPACESLLASPLPPSPPPFMVTSALSGVFGSPFRCAPWLWLPWPCSGLSIL